MTRAAVPHDPAAETALLGTMIATRPDIDRVLEHGVTAHDFYDPRHQAVFNAIVDLHFADQRVDVITVANQLTSTVDRDAVRRLVLDAAGLVNIPEYARIVRDHARRRQLLAVLADATEAVRNGDDPTTFIERLTDTDPATTDGLRISDLAAVCAGTITEEHPTLLTRLDHQPLLYEQRISALLGEPSVGKTWIAFAAAAETLTAGGSVIALDWEDTDTNFVTRMRALGVTDHVLADQGRVVHIHPEQGLRNPHDIRHAVRLVERLPAPVLVIVDAYGPALARDGVEENSNGDVLQWTDRALAPLARAGAAVLILDHVTKDPATRTRGGRGAGAKLALITGAAYEVRTLVPFARGRAGRLRLIIAKDRLGHVGPVGSNAGEVVITPDGDRLHIDVEPPQDKDQPFRPTHLMEKVSRYVEELTEPVSKRQITTTVSGNTDALRAAVDLLAAEGYLTDSGQSGRGGGVLYVSGRPFREPTPTAPQPRPNRAQGAVPETAPTAPPTTFTSGGVGAVPDWEQGSLEPTAPTEEHPPFDPHEEPPDWPDQDEPW